MSNNNRLSTLLENLPVEIFLEVFTFLRLRELITAFFDLNSRINSIIRSVTTANHVVRFNDVNNHQLSQLFPSQIRHLLIVNGEMSDFTSFINLRSLTLKYGTSAQFDSIRPQNMPMLEILHIKKLHTNVNENIENMNNLFQVILSNGFPRLRICTAFDIGVLEFNNSWTGSSALRTLNLNLKTTVDCEQVRAICPKLHRLTTYDSSINLDETKIRPVRANKRLCVDIKKLEQLELENKFILDVTPWAVFDNKEPPSRFNNTTIQISPQKETQVILGRILPQTEPYCRASFLIRIALCSTYPFTPPEVRFLDPIYHPSVDEKGCHTCCSRHLLGDGKEWAPTTSLATLIESMIDAIDNISKNLEHANNTDIASEYRNERAKFDIAALKNTLSFGRPRD